MRKTNIQIEIHQHVPAGVRPIFIKKSARIIFALLKKQLGRTPPTQMTCVFVGKIEGAKLNAHFRKKNYPTDVLSFAPVEEGSLGELAFCVPVLKSQAKEHKISLQNEFLYLLVHGILHLLGYEHEKSDIKAKQMYRLQDKIYAELRK